MPINPSLALSVRPVEMTDPLAMYGKIAAIQGAQNQNQLAQYQLGAAQRAEAKDIARTNALAQAGADDTAVANALLRSGDLKGYTDFMKARRETQKTDLELFDASMKQIRDAWGRVRTPEEALAVHEATHRDPIVGSRLTAMGVTEPMGRQQILEAAQNPQTFAQFVQRAQLGAEKFMELNKPQLSTKDTGSQLIDRTFEPLTGKITTLSTTAKTATPGEQMTDARARERLQAEMATGQLTPESLDVAANVYLQTGQLPTGLGKAAAGLRSQVMNRATELSGGKPAADVAGDIVGAKLDVASRAKAIKDFSTGTQGRQVNAFNTAIDHLDTMDKLSDALQNSDVKAINAIGNVVARQTGAPAPTNFDAAKQIVTAEVIKAVVASGGGVTERQEAERNFAAASSPAQLKGVIDTYKKLLGGQLNSLGLQYANTTGRKDFEAKLTPAAKTEFQRVRGAEQPAGAAPRALAPADQQALDWANANPKDPRAAQIKQRLGL